MVFMGYSFNLSVCQLNIYRKCQTVKHLCQANERSLWNVLQEPKATFL